MTAPRNSASAIIDAFGGTGAMAEAFGVGASAVSNWRKDGRIPARLHLRILTEAERRGVAVSVADLIGEEEAA